LEGEEAVSPQEGDPVHDDAEHPEGPGSHAKPGRPWHFRDVESLWDALERYHHYHEGTVTRKLEGGGHGRGEGQGIQLTDEWARFMLANKAIDRAMVRLGAVEPKLHLLLHHYYRRGLCEDASGWVEASAKAGLVLKSRNHLHRKAFDYLLERAVWVLFALHRAPRRGW